MTAKDRAFALLCNARVTLLVLGVLALLRGVFYLPALTPSDRIPALEEYLPLPWWAGLWIAVGALTVASAVTRYRMSAAVGMQVGMALLWAVLYTVAWIAGYTPRGYVTQTTYGGLAWLILSYFARVDMEEE